jgi:hypothetical protein
MKHRWANSATLRVALFLLVPITTSPAGVIIWTNTNGGLWNVGSNWSPAIVPGVGDDVWITNTGIYTVTQDVHVTVASLTLGGASGSQTLTNAGASLTVGGAIAVQTNGVLGLGNGTLATSGGLTLNGHCLWHAGTWSGPVFIGASGLLNISGTADHVLSGAFNNGGVVRWSGANTLYLNSCRLTNGAGGVLEIQNNQNLLPFSGAPTVVNSGTLRKSAGGGDTIIGVPLVNTGTLGVQSGRVA